MTKRIIIALIALLALTMAAGALAEDAPRFDTLEDAGEYIYERARECRPEIELYIDPDELAAIKDNIADRCRAHTQQFSNHVTYYNNSGRIVIEPAYYSGTRIAHAIETANYSGLTMQERQALDVAWSVAQQALSSAASDFGIELWLHDWMCENITYRSHDEDDRSMENCECAVGALLEGYANCQGYADTFCLLGRLCGLEVRSMHGRGSEDWHRWNTIRLGGKWYFVDVTYDDVDIEDHPDMHQYAWLNIGLDNFDKHTWDDFELAVPVEANTGWKYTPYLNGMGRSFSDMGEAAKYAYSQRRDEGEELVYLMYSGESDWSELSDAIKRVANSHDRACSWYINSNKVAGKTYYVVKWTKWG